MAVYPTHAHAARWLRDRHRYHVEPTPLPYNRWKVWIVILGKPNLQDGKLNACDLEGDTFETYDEAMEAGLSFALKTLLDAERKAKSLDPRKVREMREELREKGFDV